MNEPRLWPILHLTPYRRKLTNKIVTTLIDRSQRFLRRLDISSCLQVSESGLKQLVKSRSLHLEELALSGTSRISFGGLADILKQLARLQVGTVATGLTVLDVSHTAIQDAHVAMILQNVASLKTLDLSHCNQLTRSAFPRTLKPPYAQLETLNLASTSIDDTSLAIMAQYFTKSLRVLDLSATAVTQSGFISLSKFEAIADLDLSKIETTRSAHEFYRAFEQMVESVGPGLRSFKMEFTSIFSDDCLLSLAQFSPNLVTLSLSNAIELTDHSVQIMIQLCPNLEVLNLAASPRISDTSIVFLQDCHNLKILNLSGSQIGEVGLRSLQDLSNMVELHLSSCNAITSKPALLFARETRSSATIRLLDLNYCLSIKNETFQLMRKQLPRCIIRSRLS